MSTIHPVFIIGGSRTGSEYLKDFLREYSSVDMLPEMGLLCPGWLHTDFDTMVRREVGDISQPAAVEPLLDLMYSGRLFGFFWQTIATKIDRDELRRRLTDSDRSLRSIFLILMELHAAANGKSRLGAKFPVYYSHAHKLLEWFPDCRIVHTMRDPRAVYASQSNKHLKGVQGVIRTGWTRFKHFAQINLQFAWTMRIHNRLAGHSGYLLSRFEDRILEPEKEMRKICEFVGVEFTPEMLKPSLRRNSSYDEERTQQSGLERNAIDAWRSRIHPLAAGTLARLNGRAMRQMGYE